MHVDQFNNIGGIDVAIDLNLNSVSHLDKTDKESLKELSKKDTVGIIFPTERMFLLKDGKLGRRVADSGVPLAISTDFNPGTSPTINFYLALSLSVIREGLSIEEAINASTINPAFALSIHEDRGSIEKGKLANLQILSLKTYKLIPYFFGMNYFSLLKHTNSYLTSLE
ncbi:MAG: amidohydrolase family protein [Caldisericia bacterium]|nr:amidohydrolase family protein [Caldisericia bacterium]